LSTMLSLGVGCTATPTDNFIVFGGIRGSVCSNETYIYNPLTQNWTLVNASNTPAGRYGSAVVSYSDGFFCDWWRLSKYFL